MGSSVDLWGVAIGVFFGFLFLLGLLVCFLHWHRKRKMQLALAKRELGPPDSNSPVIEVRHSKLQLLGEHEEFPRLHQNVSNSET